MLHLLLDSAFGKNAGYLGRNNRHFFENNRCFLGAVISAYNHCNEIGFV